LKKKPKAKASKKMEREISKPEKVDESLLYQELKDSFVSDLGDKAYKAFDDAPALVKKIVAKKMVSKKEKIIATKCANCGWFSGGAFGPNQHAGGCKKIVLESEPVIPGPFTASTVYFLCRKTDKEKLKKGFYFNENTPQKVLDYFNSAWSAGGFKSINEWWDNGFNVVFGQDPAYKWSRWKDDETIIPDTECLFYAFQTYILANSSPAQGIKKSTRLTQKARGIEKLQSIAWKNDVQALSHLFVSNEQVKQIANATFPEKDAKELFLNSSALSGLKKGERLIFARCCPLTPRHGFTDSVFVPIGKGHKDFLTILGELCHKMLADDEQAELILMQPCFAHFNIVTNEKAIVIGKGHDGATGGRDTFTFPVSKAFEHSNAEKESIGLSPESGVFCEYVGRILKRKRESGYSNAGAGASGGYAVQATYLTQLRGGPKIDVTGDYVPREIALDPAYLIPHKNPETDEEYRDTEWEKVINDVKKQDDWQRYFVYHPGGAISSHFGVHCYINEIPYITSTIRLDRESILKANSKTRETDLNAFKIGFQKGPNLLPLIKPETGIRILLAALHNYPALDTSDPKQAEFLGFAVEFAIHLGLATCLGELRYADRKRMDLIKTKSKGSREYVYYHAQMFDLNYVLRKSHHKCPWFGIPDWGSGSSVGGLKWLECSKAVFDLWNATCEFMRDGGKGSLGAVIEKLNIVVNICHNAAKMLTKFTGNPAFDFAVREPHNAAFKIAPILFELLNADVEMKPICFESFDLPKRKWDANLLRKKQAKVRRVSAKAALASEPTVPLSPKKGYEQCQTCGWYWGKNIPLEHHDGCKFYGMKMPVEVIKPVKDYDQCKMCGYYVTEGYPQLHHLGCPIACSKIAESDKPCIACGWLPGPSSHSAIKDCPKNAASEEPSAFEPDDKCSDSSCSSCYPQHAGK
jgi:hypothetical protein